MGRPSLGLRMDADDFAGPALGHDFKGTATHLAIGREALVAQACIHDQFTVLAAIRALEVHKFFHVAI